MLPVNNPYHHNRYAKAFVLPLRCPVPTQVLDQCISCVDFAVFLQHLESGLKDHYDVKLPCHSMLTKLASVSPHTVLVTLDKLVEPLEKTLAVSAY